MLEQRGFISFVVIATVLMILVFGAFGVMMLRGQRFLAVKAYHQEMERVHGYALDGVPADLY